MRNVEMTREESDKLQAALGTVRKHVSRIHHDMNNPMSVISGNVQLLQELARALHVQDDFEEPLKDVAAALEQLTTTTDELLVVRNLLAQLNQD